MIQAFILFIICVPLSQAAETTYHLQKLDTPRDVLAVNENFRSLSGGLSRLDEDLQSQVTALSSAVTSAGYAELKATQTFSGANTHAGYETFNGPIRASSSVVAETGIAMVPSAAQPLNSGGLWYYAKSIDGASQSSGCLVAVQMSASSDPSAYLTFTSTTTNDIYPTVNHIRPGVLLESCSPSTYCRVGMYGVYRITTVDNIADNYLTFSTTRCQPDGSSGAGNAIGSVINSCPGGLCWAFVGAP